ncbi:MAG: hypothetical protein AB7L76_09205 [Burkholderiaceae bacterium]
MRPRADRGALPRWPLDALIALSVGLLLLMFFPGGMSIDSYTQLLEARSGRFEDWHPPFMAWLWRMMETVAAGPLPMLLAQLALFVAALALFARRAMPGDGFAQRLFVLLTLWCVPVSGIIGVIWKDVWTSCLLLLAAACVLPAARPEAPARRAVRAAVAAGAMLGALLFRHNAVFAILPLLLAAGWQWTGATANAGRGPTGAWTRGPVGDRLGVRADSRADGRAGRLPGGLPGGRTRRLAVAGLAGVAATAALLAAASTVNRALTVRQMFPVQSIFLFDLAGIVVRTGRVELLAGQPSEIAGVLRGRETVPVDALRVHYYPSTWTPLVFVDGSPLSVTTDGAQVDALGRRWRHALWTEPAAYLEHRMGVFQQVTGAHGGGLFAPVYFGIPAGSPDVAEVGRSFAPDAGDLGPAQQQLRRVFEYVSTLPVHRPWFWLALNLPLIAAAAFYSRRGAALAALGASGLLSELALFFIAPSADYRYSHWLVLSTWALGAALIGEFAARRAAARTRVRNAAGIPAC